ncbi:MAG: putative porin, partial [Lentisphaeria bacterium]|nr:putative porin [Lentisphaeria bacterium]
ANSNDEVLRKIEDMQRQVQAQQEMITQLRSQLDEQRNTTTETVRQEVETAVSKGLAQSGGSVLTLGKGIEGLTLTGDLRLRYESIDTDRESDGDLKYKSRFRHRVRLGGVWKNPGENWEVGLGFEAGSGDGTSANDSWNQSSVWESGSLYLDYAYAKHTFGDSGMSLTLGQQKNPWKHTFLTFDGDLRPTGATLAYANDLVFATVGAYNLRGDATVTGDTEQSLANMFGGQAGLKFKTDDLSALFALGFFHYDAETTEFSATPPMSGYNYQIGTAYAEIGGKVGGVGLKAVGEFAMNFGADNDYSQGNDFGKAPASLADYEPEDNDMAWTLGLQAKFDKFSASYAYAHIEGDSIPWFVSDSDFGVGALGSGRSINVQGHVLGLGYAVTKNFSLGATAMFTSLIEPAAGSDDDGTLFQFDAVYKF